MPRLFAIGDLHLSHARPKPMSIFGEEWADHTRQLEEAWGRLVKEDDIVLVAGDISWAMRLSEALPDLEWIQAQPGTKVLIRGNHDYWWQSIGKLRKLDLPSLRFLQYDTVRIGPFAIGGTRLWDLPEVRWPQEYKPLPGGVKAGPRPTGDQDAKIVERELNRLELSLSRMTDDAPHRVAMVHHPPVGSAAEPSRASEIIARHEVDLCVFGHLHSLGRTSRPGADCTVDGTRYVLVSADWVGFEPRVVWEW